MSFKTAFLIVTWAFTAGSLPLAPAPPDFKADFSKRSSNSDLMPVVGEDDLQSLRKNGFQEQLDHLRDKNIGRDSAKVTEEMARIRNSIEDISEFSLDSNEVDEAINDITVPSDNLLKKSSKFAELAEIHNTDASNKALPPFAFSEDQGQGGDDENVERVEVAVPTPGTKTVVFLTSPTTTPSSTTRTTTPPLPTTSVSTTQKFVNVDSDVSVSRRSEISITSTPLVDGSMIQISTTTLPPAVPSTIPTARYSLAPSTSASVPLRNASPHIFSSSTVRLPSAISLATSTTFSTTPSFIMTTPRPYRGPFTTEFTIEPVKTRGEGRSVLRDRIRSTSQLLNLLGDRIEGIDQKAMSGPRTGVVTNVYDQGVVKRRNNRMKQWGVTGASRHGIQTYDGQFSGVAYGSTKQKGGGYVMRKKMSKNPWQRKSYRTRRLGKRRPEDLRSANFVEKKTTDVALEPYGSVRRGQWIRGVRVSERRNAVRRVSEKQKSFAEALLESEEASMRQLKKTLRRIRDVVKYKTASSTSQVTTTHSPSTATIRKVKKPRVDSSYYSGQFDLRH